MTIRARHVAHVEVSKKGKNHYEKITRDDVIKIYLIKI